MGRARGVITARVELNRPEKPEKLKKLSDSGKPT